MHCELHVELVLLATGLTICQNPLQAQMRQAAGSAARTTAPPSGSAGAYLQAFRGTREAKLSEWASET